VAQDKRLAQAFSEVHRNIPSTVPAHIKGKRREKMLAAIAYSKARKKGAKV
jgi:hypothetical protein